MIIFEIIWFLIKAWFIIFTFGGAFIGFAIGLGLAISIIAFGWELLVDKWNQQWKKQSRRDE